MLVKNISSRAHHVGDKVIVPNEVAEISEEYATAINSAELVEVNAEGDELAEVTKPKAAPKKK
jgi:hypothetical protein